VDLLSETHLKPHVRLINPNYHCQQTGRFPGRKGETRCSEKGIPHNLEHNVTPIVSIKAKGACIEIGNSEMILAGDLNEKRPFSNSLITNFSDETLLT
jgi:hypothetical protein